MLSGSGVGFTVHPSAVYRSFFPGAEWRIVGPRRVSLTFDDGPHPRITPWTLAVLESYGLKGTFFCVGENVVKYPEVFRDIRKRGHTVGNHTYNHQEGLRTGTKTYLQNVARAGEVIPSRLFRPPHGILRPPQFFSLRKSYRIIMWDIVTRDYDSRLSPREILSVVYRSVREGSILVFHDSEKAEANLLESLPRTIDFLLREGYQPTTLEG